MQNFYSPPIEASFGIKISATKAKELHSPQLLQLFALMNKHYAFGTKPTLNTTGALNIILQERHIYLLNQD